MIGHIASYDPEMQTGVIQSGEQFFEFELAAWLPNVPPDEGDDVRFETNDTVAININLVGAYLEPPKAVKYKYVAGILALLFGWIGAHRFYLGFWKMGLAQIAVTALTVGYGALWGFIEAVLLLTGNIDKDAKGRPLK